MPPVPNTSSIHKSYRVATGDRIVVEKLAGEVGDSVTLEDVLLAGSSDLKATSGLVIAAEIVAQAKADKVTVFKKRRRHGYRRKSGHRQQLTILKILSIGGGEAEEKAFAKATVAPKVADDPASPEPLVSASEKRELAALATELSASANRMEKNLDRAIAAIRDALDPEHEAVLARQFKKEFAGRNFRFSAPSR